MSNDDLIDLITEKILTGGRRTTAVTLREVVTEMVNSFVNSDTKNEADGVAGLDADGLIDPTQLPITSGVTQQDGDGAETEFDVAHNFNGTPTNIQLTAMHADSAALCFIKSIDANKFVVKFVVAPPATPGNVHFAWIAK